MGISPSAAMADLGAPWDVTEPADYYAIVTSGDGVNIRSFPDESQNKVGFAPYEARFPGRALVVTFKKLREPDR